MTMWYKVVYNKENRLRLRSGRYAFTKKEGYCIAELILEKTYIKSVTTSHINGSIFISFNQNEKDETANNKK